MKDVVSNDERDQNVAVEKKGQRSSSNARTSSLVSGRPTETTGSPVRLLTETFARSSPARARRTSMATVALNEIPWSRAMTLAIR